LHFKAESRIPEEAPQECPECGYALNMDISAATGDAYCPACGQLLRFGSRNELLAEFQRGLGKLEFEDKLANVMLQLDPPKRQILELRLKRNSNAEVAAELGVFDRKIRRVVELARALMAAQ
jgi:hypothetical protein